MAALTRVLFAPPGSSSFLMFDPLLLRNAPAECKKDGETLPKCSQDDSMGSLTEACCIDSYKNPPLRYRLDTYYGATSFAWSTS